MGRAARLDSRNGVGGPWLFDLTHDTSCRASTAGVYTTYIDIRHTGYV